MAHLPIKRALESLLVLEQLSLTVNEIVDPTRLTAQMMPPPTVMLNENQTRAYRIATVGEARLKKKEFVRMLRRLMRRLLL